MLNHRIRVDGLLLLIFIGVSVFYISPGIRSTVSNTHSSQLQRRTIAEGNSEITEYVDENGEIAIAAELGYARRVITYGEKHRTELFYDDNGKPVKRSAGYYGVIRGYNETGDNTSIIYLDRDGDPTTVTSGYATEELVYDEKHHVTAIRYYDSEHNPVLTRLDGYGKNNQYDEFGRISSITYVDAYGQPMITGRGYASVTMDYYPEGDPQRGRVKSERYLDEHDDPISLSLGQYGIRRGYDDLGRCVLVTYLSKDGDPMVTNKGYTTLRRTFYPDNTVATERYFDLYDEPFALPEGQYGVRWENGQTFILGEEGDIKFNLRSLLYNKSWFAVLIAIILAVVSVFLDKKWNNVLLALYLGGIFYMTLLFRDNDGSRAIRGLFSSFSMVLKDSEIRAEILRNIWLFIPLGVMLYKLCPKIGILLIPAFISVCIEVVQYFLTVGFFEIDDIISNSLGGIVGFDAARYLHTAKERLKGARERI